MSDDMVDQTSKLEETTVPNNLLQQHKQQQPVREKAEYEEQELHMLLVPDIRQLPLTPSAFESNFVSYFAPDFMKPGNDQYFYSMPMGGITAVDFNVGKSDRSCMTEIGNRKKNAQHFESNTALCKVCTRDDSYIVRLIEKDT
ncbi:hypothetical protein CRYUN_Cryun27aG0110400 [Craigia yunnanensis]